MDNHETNLIKALEQLGLFFPNTVIEKLFTFLKYLLEANRQTNLTAITQYEDALYKHLLDALYVALIPEFLESVSILDVGSGAGIPVIPLAICFPEKRFTSLEATHKKILFQKETASMLHLSNIQCIWSRAEELAHTTEHREQYDIVLARAVAAANTLVEITLPFVKINGYSLLYKGQEMDEELTQANKAIKTLGGVISGFHYFQLPFNLGDRGIAKILKTHHTHPSYPRKSGTPQKRPL